MTSTEQLSAADEVMLAALATGATAAEAAVAAGCSTSTVYRRLRDRSFCARLTERRAEAWRPEANRLKAGVGRAIDVLLELLESPDAHPSTRVRAAVCVVELALKVRRVVDEAPEYAALEAGLAEMRGGDGGR